MKKVLAILLTLAMVFSLMACTGGEPQKPDQTPSAGPSDQTTKADDQTTKPDEPTTPAETDAPLPWYMWDTAHPERYGGTVRYPYDGMSPTWDPYGEQAWTTYCWAINVFQSLLVTGADGNVYPQICDYEISEDNLVIKLTIRDGVKFSNGQDVTIDDILASLQRSAQMVPSTQQYLWDLLDHYDVEGKSITFYMTKYDANTLLGVLSSKTNSSTAIMPKEICEKYGTDLISDMDDVVGTGPYKFLPEESEAQTTATMIRNEYYLPVLDNPQDNDIASPCYQYLEKLVFLNMNLNTAYLAIENDELDVLYDNTGMEIFNARLAPLGTYTFTMQPTGGVYFWFCNIFSGNRPICDANLRKAMAACFDYGEVAYAQYGEAAVLTSRTLQGELYPNYVCPVEETDWYNANSIEVAKAYLAKSNYQGEELKLVGFKEEFNIAFEAMKKAGINCTYTVLDNATLRSYATDPTADWDIIYRPGPVPSLPGIWNANLHKPWGNERVEELLSELANNPYNTESSIANWNELMELYCDECPFVIMMENGIATVAPKTLVTNRKVGEFWYMLAYWEDPENHVN